MNCFSTIITSDYFFYAQAVCDSLIQFNPDIKFHVLVVGNIKVELDYDHIEIHRIGEIQELFKDDYDIIKHYENDEASNLRWALKPLFLKFLLLHKNYNKAIFIDPDIYFYNDPLFLFEQLNNDTDVIITPHWRSKDPIKDKSNFDSLFTGGLYNAGFFGCNSNAINVLDWWLKACAYKMEKSDGYYVDQVYLNLMPVYFSKQVQVLEHRGCNVANWNMIECERVVHNDTVHINNEFPVVFIHYTNGTINNIAKGNDRLLKPFLKEYKEALFKHNPIFKFAYEKTVSSHSSQVSLKQQIKKFLKFK